MLCHVEDDAQLCKVIHVLWNKSKDLCAAPDALAMCLPCIFQKILFPTRVITETFARSMEGALTFYMK